MANIGGCKGTRFGCCANNTQAKKDASGSNCSNCKKLCTSFLGEKICNGTYNYYNENCTIKLKNCNSKKNICSNSEIADDQKQINSKSCLYGALDSASPPPPKTRKISQWEFCQKNSYNPIYSQYLESKNSYNQFLDLKNSACHCPEVLLPTQTNRKVFTQGQYEATPAAYDFNDIYIYKKGKKKIINPRLLNRKKQQFFTSHQTYLINQRTVSQILPNNGQVPFY